GFRITDRRKFNADGSPRDGADEAEPSAGGPSPLPAESAAPRIEAVPPANVLTFPGDAGRQPEPVGPAQAPASERVETPRQDAAAEARAAQAKAAASSAERAYNQALNETGGRASAPDPEELPDASFLGLIDMFAAEAAAHLGMAQTPDGKRTPVDLEAARHWIDLIGMLDV